MKKQLLLAFLAIALFTTGTLFVACHKDSDSTGPVYLPTDKPFGKTYTEWTVDWMLEFMKDDCDHNGWLNPEYILFHQTGDVYFMAGLGTLNGSVNIKIPEGKALLFPLVNFLNDYPCPDSSFQADPGQSVEDFLKNGSSTFSGVTDFMALVSNTSVTVDGTAISNTADYQFVSNLFNFTGNADLANCFDGCITGASQPGVAGGFYIMLKPLAKGSHTVHYHSEIPTWGAKQDATFNITVE